MWRRVLIPFFFSWWSDYMQSFPATHYPGTSTCYLLFHVVHIILLSHIVSIESTVLEYVVPIWMDKNNPWVEFAKLFMNVVHE